MDTTNVIPFSRLIAGQHFRRNQRLYRKCGPSIASRISPLDLSMIEDRPGVHLLKFHPQVRVCAAGF